MMSGDPNENPAEEPVAFAEPSEWLAELREQYPLWQPPDPKDPEDMLAACEYWWDDYIEIAEEHDQRDITRELKRFILTVKALARSAEVNGLSARPLIHFYHDMEAFSLPPQTDLPAAGSEVHELLDHLKIKLELQQPKTPTPTTVPPAYPPPTPAEPPPPRVVLSGTSKQPIVLGRKKDVLSQGQYNVVQTLLPAGEAGLSKDEFERKSGHPDARRILKRLYESDPDWGEVIHLPGLKGKRYRIF